MARWFTSDLHLGHANIARFCGRPFAEVDAMNAAIINTINTHVGTDDELWILGDVAMGKMESTLPWLKSLVAGSVVLVAGNHDRVHPHATRGSAEKLARWTAEYSVAGIDRLVLGNTEIVLSDGTSVQVSHFPYEGTDARPVTRSDGSVVADEFAGFRPVDDGRWLLCGHVHNAWRTNGRMVNVGIDAWGGLPIPESALVDLIGHGPQSLPALSWGQVALT